MHEPNQNPLASDSPVVWDRLIELVNPASLLVLIEPRMSARLRAQLAPEDILQDALLHAWRDRAACEWRGVRAFRAWLLTIIERRILSAAEFHTAQKRGGGARLVSLAGPGGGPNDATAAEQLLAAGSTTPSRVAIHREQAAAMQAALASVPDEQREVVRLRLFEQLPTEEIAERLGLSVATVRYRFGRGAERYQRELERRMGSRSISAHPDCSSPAPLNPSS